MFEGFASPQRLSRKDSVQERKQAGRIGKKRSKGGGKGGGRDGKVTVLRQGERKEGAVVSRGGCHTQKLRRKVWHRRQLDCTPQKAGLKRCGKSCRLRWLNYLRPDIRHGGFTEEEDNIICSLYETMGSRWSVIASQLPGRTDNDVKNYWNTKLKKKMLAAKNKLGSDAYVQMNSASISSSSSPSPSSSSPPSASTITTIASKSVGPIYSFSNLSCTKPKDEAMVMPPVEVGFPYTAEAPKQNFESVSLLASSGFTAAAPQIFPDNKPIFPSQSHNSIDNSYISWLLSGGTEDAFPLMDHAGASAFELSNNYAVQEKKVFQVGEPTPVYNPNYNFSYGSVLVNPDSSQGLYSSLAHIL